MDLQIIDFMNTKSDRVSKPYKAPEENPDPKNQDIFATGVILFQLITASKPFDQAKDDCSLYNLIIAE